METRGGYCPWVAAKLIDIAQGIADVLIRFSIVCLPFLIPLGLGAFFVTKAVKKRRAKSKYNERITMPSRL